MLLLLAVVAYAQDEVAGGRMSLQEAVDSVESLGPLLVSSKVSNTGGLLQDDMLLLLGLPWLHRSEPCYVAAATSACLGQGCIIMLACVPTLLCRCLR